MSFLLIPDGAAETGDSKKYKTFTFPYVSDNPAFVKEVLHVACKELKVDIKECQLLVSSFPSASFDYLNPVLSTTLEKLPINLQNIYPIFVSNFTLITPNGFMSAVDTSSLDANEVNSFANLVLYRQIIPNDSFDQYNVDNSIKLYPVELVLPQPNAPVIFSGDRFSTLLKEESSTYMLCFDLIKTPGIFTLKLDHQNVLPNIALSTAYNKENSRLLEDMELTTLGTLINASGRVECLVESEDGSSVLLQVEENDLFIYPMLNGAQSRVLIKNSTLGTIDTTVSGGRVGLIIDTRAKCSQNYFKKKFIAENLKNWVSRIEEALCTYQ